MTFQEYKERIIFYLEYLDIKDKYLEEIFKYYDSLKEIIIILFNHNIQIQDIFKITIPTRSKYSKLFWDQQTTLLRKAIELNLFETQNYWND